jgi:Flp pilus assembly protein TadD
MSDYNQAIALNPRNSVAYNNRGIAQESKDDLNGAIAGYD